jgi:leader peptidase (prepilin peptidase) / N-methyltransferase
LPLGLSVNDPKRSFCPSCKKQIPWHQNLPLISWLALRGKCANCGSRIAFRYFGVELLTGLLFLAVWMRFQETWILVFPYWILVSLLIVATFIDFEHFIIPDEITWGGVGAGILLSLAIPLMMNSDSHLESVMRSLIGAAVGYGTLRLVVELGKKAFGKKRLRFEEATPFTWNRTGDDADFKAGEDAMKWSELFSRESDQLIMQCTSASIDGDIHPSGTLLFHYNRVRAEGKEYELDQVDSISGSVTEIIIPREAMGLGDVKFIAAVGAFLGWQAVFFTVMSASCIGAIVGVAGILAGKREASAKIPFGPYLALGALIWLFAGWEIVNWYLRMVSPAG